MLIWMQWPLRAALSFPVMSRCPLLSGWYILGFLVDLGLFGDICPVCAIVCFVPYVLWNTIKEVWSMHHEASFSDCFDSTACFDSGEPAETN